jgi:hypothetical protein
MDSRPSPGDSGIVSVYPILPRSRQHQKFNNISRLFQLRLDPSAGNGVRHVISHQQHPLSREISRTERGYLCQYTTPDSDGPRRHGMLHATVAW